MPEAVLEPAQSPQGEPIASTPQKPADQPTTVETSEKGLLDFLDIPPELRAQLTPKPVEPEKPVTPSPEEEVHPEIPTPEEEDEGEEEVETPVAAAEQPPQRIDKRQKRINRLTRQKSELQEQLDAKDQRERALLEKIAQYEGRAQPGPTVPTTTSPRLAHITDELSLNREIVKAQEAVDWYDNHPDGMTVLDAKGQEQYLPPDEVAQRRRAAEKVLLEAPNRRQEIRDFNLVRNHFDNTTRENFPKLYDPQSEEYQYAAELRKLYPVLNTMPNGDYALGLLIEGAKSVQEKQSKNGQPQKAHRDIDERVFTTPRVPIAPHTPGPPTRESTPSSQKMVNEAMSRLIKDPDGSADALVDVFRARDEAARRQPTSRSEVKV